MTKRKPAHDPDTGRFEARSPMNDPAMLEQTVRWVRAIDELEPLIKGMHEGFGDEGDQRSAVAMKAVDIALSTMKASMIEALAIDPQSKREALKKPLRAARLN